MGQMTLVIWASKSSVIQTVQMSRSGPLRCLNGNPAFLPKLVPHHHFEFSRRIDKDSLWTKIVCLIDF